MPLAESPWLVPICLRQSSLPPDAYTITKASPLPSAGSAVSVPEVEPATAIEPFEATLTAWGWSAAVDPNWRVHSSLPVLEYTRTKPSAAPNAVWLGKAVTEPVTTTSPLGPTAIAPALAPSMRRVQSSRPAGSYLRTKTPELDSTSPSKTALPSAATATPMASSSPGLPNCRVQRSLPLASSLRRKASVLPALLPPRSVRSVLPATKILPLLSRRTPRASSIPPVEPRSEEPNWRVQAAQSTAQPESFGSSHTSPGSSVLFPQ